MRRRDTTVSRFLPFVYLAMATALAVAILPSALRPPPQQPPSTSAFSPDAPPDSEQVLLSELGRGKSATAGAGEAVAAGEAAIAARAVVEKRPSRGKCFGNPPRQVESIYAPPCVPAFTGKNPGATWKGVTATEIRWGLLHARSDAAYEGPVAEYTGDEAVVRSWRVWEKYFNQNFELYGRTIRFFTVNMGTDGWREGPKKREAVRRLVEDYKVMGITPLASTPPGFDEAMRRRDVFWFGDGWGEPRDHDPMLWQFHVYGPRAIRFVAELTCKQLHGKPVSFSPDFKGQPRKLGMLEYVDPNLRQDFGELYVQDIKRMCGMPMATRQAYNLDDNPSSLATVMTRFRAEGITTIFCMCDPVVTPIVVTNAATENRYFPEWVHGGWRGIERNQNADDFNSEQWRNSIGLSAFEMNGARPSGQDWYRSYKEIDPDNEPDTPDWEAYPWHNVMHAVGAMQMAGPVLTPATMREGMLKRWPPRPPDPSWSIGGGYGPGEWNYSKYVQLMWWDPNALQPGATTNGAYRYLFNGNRFGEGEIPSDPLPWFKDGITEPPGQDRL